MKKEAIVHSIQSVSNQQLTKLNADVFRDNVLKELRINGLQTEAEYIENIKDFDSYINNILNDN